MKAAVVGVLGALGTVFAAVGCSGTSARECGPGTFFSDGQCISVTQVCGEGTRFDRNTCVPEQAQSGQGGEPGDKTTEVVCGEGTRFDRNTCVPEQAQSGQGGEPGDKTTEVGCGPGTRLEGEQCVLDGSVAAVTCGAGTEEVDGACVAGAGDITSCGAGTHLEGHECVPSGTDVTCGAGTQLSGDECLPAAGLVCGPGTERVDDECVPSSSVTCGDGTEQVGQTCVPTEVKCGPGTHLYDDTCVAQIPQVATSETFEFAIADKAGQVVYFLDTLGSAVHRYDLVQKKFLTPLATADVQASTMAVTPSGDIVYVGSTPGRINSINTASGTSSFFGAAAGQLLWMTVTGNYLYSIDDSGAWESHATFSRASGARVFSDEWRNYSRGAAYAPTSRRVFTFRDGTSPNDIYYEEVDQANGALGADIESPYHGDYVLGHPIRVSPDETTVFVASGVAFNAADLTYKTSIGIPYTDLTFGGQRSYLLHGSGDDSEVLVLDSKLAIASSFAVTGKPLRVFVHGGRLTTFTRQSSAIAVSNVPL